MCANARNALANCRIIEVLRRRVSLRMDFHFAFHRTKETAMNITLTLAPLISLIAGVLILVMPRLLNYIVAAYLIVVGLLGLFGGVHLR